VVDGYTLDDLVLPGTVRGRIEDFIAACRNRRKVYEEWGMQRRLGPSRGLAALFSGSSGTGKSMAASAIAKKLSLDLYRIELSAVVSKYIGETEKNLDEVFAAACAANCILFFDEADALFGKRSEVKDAHDRYANIECAYLLQKMERHDGLVILTTNMPRSIDQAFSRRIQFAIEFPRPDIALREALWRGMFPPGVPFGEEIDFGLLARNFEITGGEIRNVALDAALRAACLPAGSVTMLHLLEALERQMIKQGRAPAAAAFKQRLKPLRQAAG
jgi:SpoVK/Ycf46/Vps4 family AAA+-type ATPase